MMDFNFIEKEMYTDRFDRMQDTLPAWAKAEKMELSLAQNKLWKWFF